jgi:CheY-like chemotaxis protein
MAMTVSADQSSSPLRILVVDDRQAITMTFQWMLEILGHEVRTANSGHDALAIAPNFLPQVILSDISLPDMDGYELCKILRNEAGFEKTIFVAQTGHAQPEYRERSRLAGFDHHLVKPVTTDQLTKIFASCDFANVA